MIKENSKLPILPLRDIIIFPSIISPLFVGRERSILSIEESMKNDDRSILLLAQKNPEENSPEEEDMYSVGVIAKILQFIKLPDGTVKILIEGINRVDILKIYEEKGFLKAYFCIKKDSKKKIDEINVLMKAVLEKFEQYVRMSKKIPTDVSDAVSQISESSKFADTIASNLKMEVKEKQKILETFDSSKRLEMLLFYIEQEISILNVEKRVKVRVKKQMEKTQKDYYLNEQLKAIYRELGEKDGAQDEIVILEEKIKKTKLSKEAKEKAQSELKKLKIMSSSSAEATVIRNYLDWLLSIPWQTKTKFKKDIKEAEKILNEDHYGLEKVKDRILEFIAVQNRVGKMQTQILCLLGPPGVGKTSLAKSIAKATGRSYVRVALGGIHDESEIRGHRKTYIGAMPGKIIQGMKKAKYSNPLFLLDEIDKVGNDWRGDPSSALLEALDPEQNFSFNDNYIEVDYDLSDVMFVTTANSSNILPPLLDRMEVVRISGYTEEEKLHITKLHLVPKLMSLVGLNDEEFKIDDNTITSIIRNYTFEAGVRNLEREISKVMRKVTRKIVSKEIKEIEITSDNISDFLGSYKYSWGKVRDGDIVGLVNGLAWTEAGGDLLSIETVVVPGQGKILTTGKLGNVMQESAQAAISYIRSQAANLGIDSSVFEKRDIHLHVPEGAIPKDGPSAGISICVSIVSAITEIPVKAGIAMTGEITLLGRVLKIGGLKEKLLAASRGGIKSIIIPKENEKDLEEIPKAIRDSLEIFTASEMDSVFSLAFTKKPPFGDLKNSKVKKQNTELEKSNYLKRAKNETINEIENEEEKVINEQLKKHIKRQLRQQQLRQQQLELSCAL